MTENQKADFNPLDILPGKATKKRVKTDMVRVDHAGEFGAVEIYRGQAAVLSKASDHRDGYQKICHMGDQEKVHLGEFNKQLPQRHIRPSMLSPLWKRGGFAMGALTALISKESAMACTEAVETVIDGHYQEQIAYFEKDSDPLTPTLEKFRQEELEHKEEAVEDGAQQAPFYKTTNFLIQSLCKAVIKAAEKV